MGDVRGAYRVGWGDLWERDHFKGLDVDGRIITKCIFKIWEGGHDLHLSSSGQGQMAVPCECGIELSGSTKCGEFLDILGAC